MKFSIITVCYNSAKTIEQTIQSVLLQDYDELEYIIAPSFASAPEFPKKTLEYSVTSHKRSAKRLSGKV